MKAKAAAKLAASKADEQQTATPTPAFAVVKKTPPPVREFEKNVAEAVQGLPKESITMPLSNIVQNQETVATSSGSFRPFEVPSHLFKELTPEEKAEKERRENPTVDENGEHIQTVAEAKLEAAALQNMLDEGVRNVDEKIAAEQQAIAQMPANPEPVKQEEDDGHIETVEEVRAKMKALSENMN